jgi:hypothetical protein
MELFIFFVFGFYVAGSLAYIYILDLNKKQLLKTIKEQQQLNQYLSNEIKRANSIFLKFNSGTPLIKPEDLAAPKKKKKKEEPPVVEQPVKYNVDDILKEISEKGVENISQDKLEYLNRFNNKK